MKKSITLIIIFFSIFLKTNAFFGDPSSIDLYKNIDSGLYKLEDKMLGFELNGGERETGILKEINQLAVYKEIPKCLDEGKVMSVGKFKQITTEENIYRLTKYFSESCYDVEKGTYSSEIITSYMSLFKEYLKEKSIIAKNKTKKIYQVSSIGLYSDGIIENSGFDLITDIENIDKIIFTEVIKYEGEANGNLKEFINSLTEGVDDESGESLNPESDGPENDSPENNSSENNSSENNNSENNNSENYSPENDSPENDSPENRSNYICLNNEEDSGLDKKNLFLLLYKIEKKPNSGIITNLTNGGGATGGGTTGGGAGGGNEEGKQFIVESPISDYQKSTDNLGWPCYNFFCINIEFLTYGGNLFGAENMTIEYLIKRSNEHLGKFAGTSLLPTKMSTNNFELGFESLDLPNIFHLGIQISKKPIPILNIEKEGKRDETEYASKNLLEEYYEANGLDYKRRNSLVGLESIEQNKQNINNSVGLTLNKVIYNNDEYGKYEAENNNSSTLNKIIEKKVSYGITQNFEEQFIELNKFITGINDYIENLYSIIREMEKIPIINN